MVLRGTEDHAEMESHEYEQRLSQYTIKYNTVE